MPEQKHFNDPNITDFNLESYYGTNSVSVNEGEKFYVSGELVIEDNGGYKEAAEKTLSDEIKKIIWSVSDPDIAEVTSVEGSFDTINSNDTTTVYLLNIGLTAYDEGKITLTGTTSNDITAKCEVEININSDTDSDVQTDSDTDTDTDSDIKIDSDTDTDSDTDSDTKKPTTPDKPKAPTPLGTVGDLDGDGNITSADALLILRASVKLENFTDIQNKLADADNDGNISSSDALLVLRHSVGLKDTDTIGKVLTQ